MWQEGYYLSSVVFSKTVDEYAIQSDSIFLTSTSSLDMLSLDILKSSNERIRSTLPGDIVAVFDGGTNGVGETTVRQFTNYYVRTSAASLHHRALSRR